MFLVILQIRISNGDLQLKLLLGIYERLVGMVKSSLEKAIDGTFLTKSQFINFTTESEGIINSWPLAYIDNDINSTSTIAPMHFLSLNPKIGTLSPSEDLS